LNTTKKKQVPFTIGIDVGGTKVYGILLDHDDIILARAKKKTKEGTPEAVLERIKTLISNLLEETNTELEEISGIGIGFPGPLDPTKGIVLEATNLPGWDHFPLTQHVSDILEGTPAFLDNDVNLGTLGEALAGAGKGASNVIGIFLGTGVGGGLVFNKRLFHGTSGTAGEIGHMIIQHGGPPSPRNLRGSVEGLTSRTAIVQNIEREIKNGAKSLLREPILSGKKIRSSALAKAFKQGDKLVVRTLEQTAEFVGVTVGSLINLLAPDVVVLGGGVMEAAPEAILPIAKRVAKKIAVPDAWNNVRVQEALLADDAGAMGGALLARQKIQIFADEKNDK